MQHSDTNFKNPTAVGVMFDTWVGKALAVKFSVQDFKSRSSERLRSKLSRSVDFSSDLSGFACYI